MNRTCIICLNYSYFELMYICIFLWRVSPSFMVYTVCTWMGDNGVLLGHFRYSLILLYINYSLTKSIMTSAVDKHSDIRNTCSKLNNLKTNIYLFWLESLAFKKTYKMSFFIFNSLMIKQSVKVLERTIQIVHKDRSNDRHKDHTHI